MTENWQAERQAAALRVSHEIYRACQDHLGLGAGSLAHYHEFFSCETELAVVVMLGRANGRWASYGVRLWRDDAAKASREEQNKIGRDIAEGLLRKLPRDPTPADALTRAINLA